MTHLGFTGTRQAINAWQKHMVFQLLNYHYALGFRYFHHGGCVGADEFAATSAHRLGYTIIKHPPLKADLQANTMCHELRQPLPYLDRNTEIVRESVAGIAVPHTTESVVYSGTWSTIRKFHTANIPHWIITPIWCWSVIPTDTGVPAHDSNQYLRKG